MAAIDSTPLNLKTQRPPQGEAAMSISDSGGFEGSRQRLSLGGSQGAVVRYSFEHFNIPDNFLIRYQGQNLLETGFVSGSSSGQVQVPTGTDDFVEVLITTNDSGTAWNYTASSEGSCAAPGDYTLDVIGGAFMPNEAGLCEATGTVTIGRASGITELIRVENAEVSFDPSGISVRGTVFSEIGAGAVLTDALFTGQFTLPTIRPTATGFTDQRINTNELALGGSETNFTGLTLNRREIALGVQFEVTDRLGVPNFSFGGVQGLVITPGDAILASVVRSTLPTLRDVQLFGFLGVKQFKDFSVEYDATQNAVRLRGDLTLEINSRSPVKEVTANFAGMNFIELKDGDYDIVGELSATTDLPLPRGWGLEELKLRIDTIENDVDATARLRLPFRGSIEAEGTVGFKLPLDPLEVNTLEVQVDGLNLQAPVFPAVFFQGFDIGVTNLAKSDTDPITFNGGVNFTLGPQFTFGGEQVSAARAKVDVIANAEQAIGRGQLVLTSDSIATINGEVTLNWDKKFVKVNGDLRVLDDFISAQVNASAASNGDLSLFGRGAVRIPDSVPFVGDTDLGVVNILVQTVSNTRVDDDFAAAWGEINISRFGLDAQIVLGVKYTFDGTFSRIGVKNIPPIGSFDIAAGQRWFVMSADWENGVQGDVPLTVIRPDGTRISEADFADNQIAIVDELSTDNSRSVIVFEPEPGIWDLEVQSASDLGNIDYVAFEQALGPEIELQSSRVDGDGQVVVQFEHQQPETDSTLRFFYDNDDAGLDGIEILDGVVNQADGTFIWRSDSVPTGQYYLYAQTFDGTSPPAYSYLDAPLNADGDSDLSVSITADQTISGPSETRTVTARVLNNSPSDSRNVVVTLRLPPGASLVDSSLPVSNLTGDVVTLDLDGVPAGQTVDLQFLVQMPDAVGVARFDFLASPGTFDPESGNDLATLRIDVTAPVAATIDLVVDRSGAPPSVSIGEVAEYTLTVTNAGTDPALDVLITESIPRGVTLGDVAVPQGARLVTSNGVVEIQVDRLNPGEAGRCDDPGRDLRGRDAHQQHRGDRRRV